MPSDKEIWVTEFNIVDHIGALRGTWLHGLMIAHFLDAFLQDGRVQCTCLHNLVRANGNAAIFTPTDHFFAGLAGQTRNGTPYQGTAIGQVMAIFGQAMAAMTEAAAIQFSPDISHHGDLFGWSFTNSQRQTAVLVNCLAEAVSVDPTAACGSKGTYLQLAAQPEDMVTGDDALVKSRGTLSSVLTIPPYSLTYLTKS
jgi:hypothetical protein